VFWKFSSSGPRLAHTSAAKGVCDAAEGVCCAGDGLETTEQRQCVRAGAAVVVERRSVERNSDVGDVMSIVASRD
jgi:hypothetical protein